MEKHFIRQDYRIIDYSISRRQFIKFTGRAGLVGAAKGLTGGLISCSSNVSEADTAETEVLQSRPYHPPTVFAIRLEALPTNTI